MREPRPDTRHPVVVLLADRLTDAVLLGLWLVLKPTVAIALAIQALRPSPPKPTSRRW